MVTLLFLDPPTFIRELQPAEVVRLNDVVLDCEVTGTAPFEVAWLKNNMEIRSSKKYAMTQKGPVFNISILKCDVSDVGEYLCIISNSAGSCSCTAAVRLKGLLIHIYISITETLQYRVSLPKKTRPNLNLCFALSLFFISSLTHRATIFHQEDRERIHCAAKLSSFPVHSGWFISSVRVLD